MSGLTKLLELLLEGNPFAWSAVGLAVLLTVAGVAYDRYRRRIDFGRYSDECRDLILDLAIDVFRAAGEVANQQVEQIRRIYQQVVRHEVSEIMVRHRIKEAIANRPDPHRILPGGWGVLGTEERKAVSRAIELCAVAVRLPVDDARELHALVKELRR